MNFAKFQESDELRKAEQRAKYAKKKAVNPTIDDTKIVNHSAAERKKAYCKNYYDQNRERILAQQKQYDDLHREELNAKSRERNKPLRLHWECMREFRSKYSPYDS